VAVKVDRRLTGLVAGEQAGAGIGVWVWTWNVDHQRIETKLPQRIAKQGHTFKIGRARRVLGGNRDQIGGQPRHIAGVQIDAGEQVMFGR
jgi:hypothetical protein